LSDVAIAKKPINIRDRVRWQIYFGNAAMAERWIAMSAAERRKNERSSYSRQAEARCDGAYEAAGDAGSSAESAAEVLRERRYREQRERVIC